MPPLDFGAVGMLLFFFLIDESHSPFPTVKFGGGEMLFFSGWARSLILPVKGGLNA